MAKDLVPKFEVIPSTECRELITAAPGRDGSNDRRVEVWNGRAWVQGWMSWIIKGMVFRFGEDTAVGETIMQARTPVFRSFMPYDKDKANPTLSLDVVEVLQAAPRQEVQYELIDYTKPALEAPRPRLALTAKDVTDVDPS